MKTVIVKIESVKWLERYKLEIAFNDSTMQIIDFSGFILNNQHPDINKYKDLERFKKFSITHGDLEWNDYELCFSIEDLYQNKNIEKLEVSHAA